MRSWFAETQTHPVVALSLGAGRCLRPSRSSLIYPRTCWGGADDSASCSSPSSPQHFPPSPACPVSRFNLSNSPVFTGNKTQILRRSFVFSGPQVQSAQPVRCASSRPPAFQGIRPRTGTWADGSSPALPSGPLTTPRTPQVVLGGTGGSWASNRRQTWL